MKTKAAYTYLLLLIISSALFLSISFRLVESYTHDSIKHFKHHTLIQSVGHRIEKTMYEDHIPGLSVALIQRNQVVLNKGYGYANVKQHTLADAQTRYEIASNTKAFTGLAILDLAQQGKIKLDDPVSNYLPWLHLNYEGKAQAITLNMLLAQTSGIDDHMSPDIEGDVPTKQDHLKGHVESLNHAELKFQPGEVFNYANMNYNILGLVIQEVTDTPYEAYMHTHMLKPLHMNHSYFKTDQQQVKKAQGYVLEGRDTKAEDPDYFRGDTPAAYLISSTSDLIPFVKMNLQPSASHQALIKQSHTPLTNSLDKPHMSGYGAGWFIDPPSNQILHPGTLPNYSSMILLDTKRHNAVILLANLNAPDLPDLAQTLLYQVEHDQSFEALYQATAAHHMLLTVTLWWVMVMFTVLCIVCIRIITSHRHFNHTSNRYYSV
ncbi:serine hydrolase domain-containing protein [Staphylococcus simulans]